MLPRHALPSECGLAVPVERVEAMLVLGDGSRHTTTLFTSPDGSVEQRLATPCWFLPTHDGVVVRLYARGAIACVSIASDDRTDEPAAAERRPVVVRMRNGVVLSGELRYTAPYACRRTADHLNGDSPIFSVYDGVYRHYIHKDHVESVEECEQP